METLRETAEFQEKKLAALRSDLRAVLDFMMRVNIEAAGGPSEDLTEEEFLPPEVLEDLGLSKPARKLVVDLLRKYARFMAQLADFDTSDEEYIYIYILCIRICVYIYIYIYICYLSLSPYIDVSHVRLVGKGLDSAVP